MRVVTQREFILQYLADSELQYCCAYFSSTTMKVQSAWNKIRSPQLWTFCKTEATGQWSESTPQVVLNLSSSRAWHLYSLFSCKIRKIIAPSGPDFFHLCGSWGFFLLVIQVVWAEHDPSYDMQRTQHDIFIIAKPPIDVFLFIVNPI